MERVRFVCFPDLVHKVSLLVELPPPPVYCLLNNHCHPLQLVPFPSRTKLSKPVEGLGLVCFFVLLLKHQLNPVVRGGICLYKIFVLLFSLGIIVAIFQKIKKMTLELNQLELEGEMEKFPKYF